MDIEIITVPYHLDRRAFGTGLGPDRLLREGLHDVLTGAGHAVGEPAELILDRDHGHETGNIFAVAGSLAGLVSAARADGVIPLVLAGDCYHAIGVMSGLSESAGTGPRRGLVWLDAHGDANTPETSASGFFDGMGLAVVLGWCWRALARGVPGFEPLEASSVVHLGGRAFDPGEREAMLEAGVAVVDAAAMRGDAIEAIDAINAIEALVAATDLVHVHLDLDVIDPTDGVASAYATDGGPSLALLRRLFAALGDSGRVVSASVCSYDPAFDEDGRAARAGIALVRTLFT